MGNKRTDWQTIQDQAPDLADFLVEINQAFGKPTALRVELLDSGQVIEVGGRLSYVEPSAMAGRVCRECGSWRKASSADGAGVCTRTQDRAVRRVLVDWPEQAVCELFEMMGGGDV
jgi:hypothetical protein